MFLEQKLVVAKDNFKIAESELSNFKLKNFKGSILYLEKEITLLENEQQKDIAKRDELLKNLKKLNQFMV